MARTANTGFYFWKSLGGQVEAPSPLPIRVANSTTLRIGDAVRVNTGGFATGAGTNPIAGVVVGFVDNNGINPFSLGYDTSGTGVSLAATYDDTLTTSSSNQTSAAYILAEVICDATGGLLFLNKSDGTLAQTNLFQFFNNDANARQIATAGASDSTGQWQLVALDPESTGGATADATKGAFRMVQRQLTTFISNSTAVIVA